MEFDDGLFVVTMEEKSSVKLADVKKKTGAFTLEKLEVTLVGTGAASGEVTLTARGSGMKLELQNPEKAKEDVLAKAKELIGAGKTLLKVAGEFVEVKVEGKKEPKIVLTLASVEPVEPKEK